MNKSLTLSKSTVNSICDETASSKYGHGPDDHNPKWLVQENIDWRVASHLGNDPAQVQEFYGAQRRGVIPAGRIKANAGIARLGTLYNCFVLAINDTFIGTPEKPGIYDTLAHASKTMGHGGGCGYNFSLIRPCGAPVRESNGLASGPVSVIKLYSQSGRMVSSAGNRRGAQMGVLNVDHPDIFDFITCKQESKEFKGFNLSVGVTDEFLLALKNDEMWELVHEVAPIVNTSLGRNDKGQWIYARVAASDIWEAIMQSTFACADPGVLLLGKINRLNPLSYCEIITAMNPCGEQALPPMAACLLGSVNLAKYVEKPFEDDCYFDWQQYIVDCGSLTRMLNNVIDKSTYPLEQQKVEALNKRRIGQGITGLGSALAMMKIKYSTPVARELAGRMVRAQQTAGFKASIEIAKVDGPFPLYDRDKYCETEYFKTLDAEVQEGVYAHGVRNSHQGSIAPTGTISMAFGGNCSSGLEPMFSFKGSRKVRTGNGDETEDHAVADYAVVKYEEKFGEVTEVGDDQFPDYFESAMKVSPKDHIRMVAALQPFVCAGISKTVNVPEDIPYEDFKDLYTFAIDLGVKGMTTFKPNPFTGSVLSDRNSTESAVEQLTIPGDKLFQLESISPENGWNWNDVMDVPPSSESHTYQVKHPTQGRFSLTVCTEDDRPYEIWAAGSDMPRNLGAICMSLSQDLQLDPAWAITKLKSFSKMKGPDGFSFIGPDRDSWYAPSLVAAVAKLVLHRLGVLGVDIERESKIESSMFATKEPKSKCDGGMSYHFDVLNPTTGDDFAMFVKEVKMPDGKRRPVSVWVSGIHNPTLTGLVVSLSLDMRVYDVSWIERKLSALLSYGEAQGDFMSFVPGCEDKRQQTYSSTVAYVAAILLNRYSDLGLIGDDSQPVICGGSDCPSCDREGTYIPLHGCKQCSVCGHEGDCG